MDDKTKDFMINKIRSEYMEKDHKALDEVLALDRKVKLPPTILVYTLGIIGALLLGFGMSLIMSDLNSTLGINYPMIWGIIVGVAGLAICVVNYPIYVRFLTSRKNKYSQEILRLTDKIN